MVKTIGDACNISTGKLDANQAVKGGDYPFFTCAEFPEQIDHYAFDGDVVLIAGNNARGNFHVSRYQGKFNAYQRTYVLTAKHGYDIDYIYYALRLELKRLREKSQGSQTKFLTMPILTSISLGNLVETEQSTVSRVLKILDKKIALNNRINAELEAMAKTLYDYWFVQFDFPDANGKPYKTSGGKMVYNATLKREIPAGWKSGTLDDLGQIVGGSTPKTSKPENFTTNGTPWITPNDLSDNQSNKFISRGAQDVSVEGIKSASLKTYPAGTVLLSSRAPIGYMAIARNELTTNQGFKSFIPSKNYSTEYVYYAVKNSLPVIVQNASGSTFKEVSGSVLKSIDVMLPAFSVADHFTKTVAEIFSRQDKLEQENQQLTALRDWLLPLLMNGQVTVK
ncbi:restriction endonuclease subunit S [Escherichia coli]|uniref:restriction endonuclease subunit S n=1 Tax=Escherichia coli TaxID=562 RepID=UPI0018214FA0|nr:restriction endonuclease subunit S [Escherichia coli]EFB7644266.1 restriction endonuclease subunit S [Escherichia coli]EGB0859409.1 restriction endonuclease subunit S [Escherichia coli]